MLVRTASVLLVSLLLACTNADSFECTASSQCMVDSIAGQCQPNGWCSFPDTACPSGQRYGELAGDRLAGECVPAESETEDVGGTSSGSTDGATVTTTPDTNGETSHTSPDLGGIPSVCGDGITDATEECDDGNDVDDDECTNACTLPRCGDGVVQTGEACDHGAGNDDNGDCTTSCTLATCGDGHAHKGVEECDGDDLGGEDCTSLGYPGGGEPRCTRDCILDPSSCDACTVMGVQCDGFVPCTDKCPGGAECYMSMMSPSEIGTCLPPCMDDDDCDSTPTAPAYCHAFGVCVLECQVVQSCPDGMSCQQTPIGPICLW